MALTATGRGSGNANTSVTSWTISPASNCTAGATIVLAINYDNAGTNGADPFSSISDSAGNTWTLLESVLNDPGAANEGVALRVYTTTQNGGTLTTGSTITISLSTGTTARAYTITEVTASAGSVTFASSSSTTGTSTTPSITTGTMASGELVIGCLGSEGGTPTADSDTSNGSWSTMVDSGTGGGAGGQHATTQNKVVTGSGTQTWNPTLSNSRDWCIAYLIYQETSTTRTATTALTGSSTTISASATFAPGTKTATASLSGGSTTIAASATFTSRLRSTDRGASQHATSAASVSIAPGSNCTAGATVWLAVAYDNAGTSGVDPFSSISDSHGNTWTLRQNLTYTAGSANDGIVLRLYSTRQTAGTLTTGSTITISFSPNVTRKAWAMGEVSSSYPIQYATGGIEDDGSTTTPSITTGSLLANDVLIGALALLGNTTPTEDSDTSQGSWTSQQSARAEASLAYRGIATQTKVVTDAGSQTYNPTLGTARHCVIGYIVFREAPYSATAALSGGSTTLSASATFAPGTKTASATLTGGSTTLAASATFSSTRTASVTLTGGSTTLAASATFAAGTKTASASLTTGSTSLSATVTFTAPVYTASVALTGGSTTLAATATFSEARTAVVTLMGGSTVLAAVIDVTNPSYTASATLTTGSTTLTAAARFYEFTFGGMVWMLIDEESWL